MATNENSNVNDYEKQNKSRVLIMCDKMVEIYETSVREAIEELNAAAKSSNEAYLQHLEGLKEDLQKQIWELTAVQKFFLSEMEEQLRRMNSKIADSRQNNPFQEEVTKTVRVLKSRCTKYKKKIEEYKRARFPYDEGENAYFEDEKYAQTEIPEGSDNTQLVENGIKQIKKKEETLKSDAKTLYDEGLKHCFAQEKKKKKITIYSSVAVGAIVLLILNTTIFVPRGKYVDAIAAMENGDYETAIELFSELGDYEDAISLGSKAFYQIGVQYMENEEWDSAIDIFDQIGFYDEYYNDAQNMIRETNYLHAKECDENGEYENAIALYGKVANYKDSSTRIKEMKYLYAQECEKNGLRDKAVELYEDIDDYKDSSTRAMEVRYQYVLKNNNNTDQTTYKYLQTLKSKGYKDSATIYNSLYAWRTQMVVNSSKDDTTTNRTSFSRGQMVYVHMTLLGGTPGQTMYPKYRAIYPYGDSGVKSFDSKYGDGYHGYVYWDNGLYTTGKITVQFMDSSENVIGSVTFRVY